MLILYGKMADVVARQKIGHIPISGMKYWYGDYFPEDHSFNCYSVDQFPNSHLPSHFHTQNQFQFFVRGTGTLGRSPHRLQPYTIQYAGAYTGYGPIVSGDQGMQYITMRDRYDLRTMFIPRDRALLKPGPKTSWMSKNIVPASKEVLFNLRSVEQLYFTNNDVKGMAVERIRIPRHSFHLLKAVDHASSMFAFVLQGSIIWTNRTLEYLDVLFARVNMLPVEIRTNDHPAELIVFFIPANDPIYEENSHAQA